VPELNKLIALFILFWDLVVFNERKLNLVLNQTDPKFLMNMMGMKKIRNPKN
jgi:hypothetical protein